MKTLAKTLAIAVLTLFPITVMSAETENASPKKHTKSSSK